jgi:DNA sulfur modification protein DndE
MTAVSLLDLVRTDFRTARPADELNSRFQKLLGLPHRYGPARLAIGRSLGMANVPKLETSFTGLGKAIKGENLFGSAADLATWTTLIIEHCGEQEVDRQRLQYLVGAHWNRGIYAMWDDWKASLNDFDTFVARLAQLSAGRRNRRVHG